MWDVDLKTQVLVADNGDWQTEEVIRSLEGDAELTQQAFLDAALSSASQTP